MTHDPMCLWWDAQPKDAVAQDCMMCELIAKVRADEQRQAGQRVESLPSGAIPAAAAGGAGAEVGW